MATIVLTDFTNGEKVFNGLNTYTRTVTTAGMHVCRIRLSKGAPSQLTMSITQTGSVNATLATLTVAPIDTTAGNTERVLNVTANCSVNDVISFVLTSSNADDQQLNRIRAEMIVTPGIAN